MTPQHLRALARRSYSVIVARDQRTELVVWRRWMPTCRTCGLALSLAALGLCSLLLISLPGQADADPSPHRQVGVASWYGTPHQGRRTASGQRFSRGHLTAAHRSLPLGTKVRVTDLRTKRHVVVTINDRGPYGGGKGRIIDLSEAAAQQIGLKERGTDRVEVVVVETAS